MPMSKINKGLLVIPSTMVILLLTVSPTFASNVVFTYAVADHGQGGWGGGPLFANGAASGSNGISFGNGANVGVFKASSWHPGISGLTGGPGVDICGSLTVTKSDGTLTGLPPVGFYPFFCLSFALGNLIPITGGPVVMCGPSGCTTVRVTPVG